MKIINKLYYSTPHPDISSICTLLLYFWVCLALKMALTNSTPFNCPIEDLPNNSE